MKLKQFVKSMLPYRDEKQTRNRYHKFLKKLRKENKHISPQTKKENLELLRSTLTNFDDITKYGGGFIYCEEAVQNKPLLISYNLFQDLLDLFPTSESGHKNIVINRQTLRTLAQKRSYEILGRKMILEDQKYII